MTERTILLFDSSHALLGECSVVGGVCSSTRLNARGERLIGHVIQKLISSPHGELMPFTDLLREWADHSGMLLVSFPSDRISAWHQLSSMQLSSGDRYAIAFVISHCSRRQQEVMCEALKQTVDSR